MRNIKNTGPKFANDKFKILTPHQSNNYLNFFIYQTYLQFI